MKKYSTYGGIRVGQKVTYTVEVFSKEGCFNGTATTRGVIHEILVNKSQQVILRIADGVKQWATVLRRPDEVKFDTVGTRKAADGADFYKVCYSYSKVAHWCGPDRNMARIAYSSFVAKEIQHAISGSVAQPVVLYCNDCVVSKWTPKP